jgi:DNA-binding transcriptional LysR family regulator
MGGPDRPPAERAGAEQREQREQRVSADLRLLHQFCVLADELHFGHAAARLDISQPTLSQSIRRLEDQLGFELFTRSSRSVSLTEPGRVLLEEARATFQQVERMLDRARAAAEGEAGTLAVGYAPSCPRTAAQLLGRYARSRPGIEVDHRQRYTARLVDELLDADIDAAIVVGHDPPDGLASEPLRDIALSCIVDPGHPLARRGGVAFTELAAYPVARVTISGSAAWASYLRRLCAEHGIAPDFVPVGDPFVALPGILADRRTVWIGPDEYGYVEGTRVPFDPPLTLPIDLFWRDDSREKTVARFVAHARSLRDAEGWLVSRHRSGRRPAPRAARP